MYNCCSVPSVPALGRTCTYFHSAQRFPVYHAVLRFPHRQRVDDSAEASGQEVSFAISAAVATVRTLSAFSSSLCLAQAEGWPLRPCLGRRDESRLVPGTCWGVSIGRRREWPSPWQQFEPSNVQISLQVSSTRLHISVVRRLVASAASLSQLSLKHHMSGPFWAL